MATKNNMPNIEYGLLVKERNADMLCIRKVERMKRADGSIMVLTWPIAGGGCMKAKKKDFWQVFAPLKDGDIETLPEWAQEGAYATFTDKYGRFYVGKLGHKSLCNDGRYKFGFEGCTPKDYRNGITAWTYITAFNPMENPAAPRFKKGDRVRIVSNGHTGTIKYGPTERIPGTLFTYQVELDKPIVDEWLHRCDYIAFPADSELETA